MTKSPLVRLFLLFAVTLFAPAVARAQFSASIQGTVTDAQKAVVADAVVMVTHTASGVTREATTTPDGVYRVPSLGPGTYRVQVVKPGFITAQRDAVTVGISEVVRLDVTLEVSGVQESVTVTTSAPVVETEQGRVSGRVDRLQLQEMPLSGRNLYNLIALQPGVTGKGVSASISGGGGADDSFAGESAPRINASGQRDEANSYTVDDTSTNGVARGGITNLTPNTESVEEVRVVSNNFSAVDGRSPGAQVQVITKAGTNQFRGSGSYYYQSDALTAKNVFEAVGAEVRQEPVRLQLRRSDHPQRAVLLHLVRGAASGRRARLELHGRDAGVPQLRAAAHPQQHRGAAAARLRAGGRSDHRLPRSREPGARRQHHRPGRRHHGRRHGVLRARRLAARQPVQRARRLRAAPRQGSPLRQLLSHELVRGDRRHPARVQPSDAEHDALLERQLYEDAQLVEVERSARRHDAPRRPARRAEAPRDSRHHRPGRRRRVRPVRLSKRLVADQLALQGHLHCDQVEPSDQDGRRAAADVRLGEQHQQLHSRLHHHEPAELRRRRSAADEPLRRSAHRRAGHGVLGAHADRVGALHRRRLEGDATT